MAIAAGSTIKTVHGGARKKGTVVALGGGYAVCALSVVTTPRINGVEQADAVGPVSDQPVVLPVAKLTETT